MTSVILPSGTYGIDAAGFSHLVSFQAAHDAGYDMVSLYLGGTYGVNQTTIERAWETGMAVQLNYERAATAALGGSPVGIAQASQAVTQAYDLGWVGETPLVFSPCDFSVTVPQFNVCDAYHRAMVEVCVTNGVTGGTYGPPFYLRHLSMQAWWPDDFVLWQWAGAGVVEPWTWAKQAFTPTHDVSHIGVAVDEDVVIKPYKFWSGYGPDHPDPLEDDMTDDEKAKLFADVAEIKAIVRNLVEPIDPGTTDASGVPINTLWQVATILGELRALAVRPVPRSGGGSATDVADEFARRLTS